MTTKLSCRDVERLIIEDEDGKLTADMRRLVEDHLRGCRRCQGFAADRGLIRETIAAVRWPAPPETLVRATRRRLTEDERRPRAAAVPAWVLVALAVTTVVTGLWLAISLADVGPEMTLADLSVAALAAVIVIVQNVLMLFLAPVVLRTVRSRRRAAESE